MKKIVKHDLKRITEDINVYHLCEEYIKREIAIKKANIIQLKYKRDDEKLSSEDFFANYYTRVYDLKLLSRNLLAAKILGSKNIKPIIIKRKETFSDYKDDNIWVSELMKISYDGYVDSSFIKENEIELSQNKIENLVFTRKLVLNPDFKKEKTNQPQYNITLPLNNNIALPYIKDGLFKSYDFIKLSIIYPDILNQIRFSLTNNQIDIDVRRFNEVFLNSLLKKIGFNEEEEQKKLSLFSGLVKDKIEILSKNRTLIKSLRNSK